MTLRTRLVNSGSFTKRKNPPRNVIYPSNCGGKLHQIDVPVFHTKILIHVLNDEHNDNKYSMKGGMIISLQHRLSVNKR
jgi:hypothetical protein